MTEQGRALPSYVQREFEELLKCDRPEYGFNEFLKKFNFYIKLAVTLDELECLFHFSITHVY